jgi:hypothetical protein
VRAVEFRLPAHADKPGSARQFAIQSRHDPIDALALEWHVAGRGHEDSIGLHAIRSLAATWLAALPPRLRREQHSILKKLRKLVPP